MMSNIVSVLATALAVEITEIAFRTGVVYRYYGRINWKTVDATIIGERGRDLLIEVSGQQYNVDLHGSKAITPVENVFSR